LADGERAINTLDEKLYFKNSAGAVKLLAANVTPAANGGTGLTAPGASGNVLTSNGTTWVSSAASGGGITSATAVASTSGTSIPFTGIPSSVKQITVMFAGVSSSGTSQWLLQLGDSGGYETTGYISEAGFIGATTGSTTQTAGFGIRSSSNPTAMQGSVIISLLTPNTWVAQGMFSGTGGGAGFTYITSGSKTLTDTLNSIRLTTVNGTDTFDAGTINIMYQ
jgi:hypothetical protein